MKTKNIKPQQPGICPKCGSENIAYGALELDGESCYYPVECRDCDFTGMEWHKLKFICFTDNEGNEFEERINYANKKI